MAINEKLRTARVARCLSEKDVYEAILADRKTYQRWEHGLSIPQPYFRKKLCDLFGMTLEQLGYDVVTLMMAHISDATALLPVPSVGAANVGAPLQISTDLLDMVAILLRMQQQQQGWTERELEEHTMKKLHSKSGQISRREFNTLAVALPLAAMALSPVPEEMLPHAEASLITAWKLARGSDLALAQSIVSAYIPALQPLAEQDSPHQAVAAQLVAKSYLLTGMINMHVSDLAAREQHCQQAVRYAEISGDVDLITASRRWLACTYYYLHQPAQALAVYGQAAAHLDSVTPLLRSSVLVESAVIQAQTGQKQTALTSLGQAQETFFVVAANDPGALYTGHD
ncbi:MAG: helix-turn-helix transcriptional regulator, partial [Ktedonobacteraceae bacterium]